MLALALCLIHYVNTSLKRVESGDVSLPVLVLGGDEWSADAVVAVYSGKDIHSLSTFWWKKNHCVSTPFGSRNPILLSSSP